MIPPGAGGGEAGEQRSEAFSYPYLTARLFLFPLQTLAGHMNEFPPVLTRPPSPHPTTQQQSRVKINETARLYFRVGCSSGELPPAHVHPSGWVSSYGTRDGSS